MMDEAFPVAPASQDASALQSAADAMASVTSFKWTGAFSPEMLAEVETIGLRNALRSWVQNSLPEGTLMAMVPSSATTEYAKK